jgi:uncharacterized protein YukE
MAGDSIKFNASLDTAGFESGAKKLQSVASGAAAGVSQHFGKIAMAVAGIGAAFLSVRAAAESFNAAIAMGGRLNELSARTGETAGNLAILERAFQNAGAGADSVGATINRLQRAVVEAGQGGKEQAEAFAKLGLNLEELKAKTPTEQLQAVGNALSRVSTDSDRSALAMQLLGRSGGELIPLLRAMGTELDIARSQLGSTPEVMDRVAAVLDTVGDNFAAIGEKGKEFAAGLLERLAPALAEITTQIATIDAAGFGQAVAGYIEQTLKWINASLGLSTALDNIRTAIAGITSGNFGDGLSVMFLTARDTAFNAINNISAAAMAALSTVGDALRQLFDPGSTTMAFINGSFNMLGAKLASSISDYLIPILENIPFMDAAAEAVRAAKVEAEQAAKDIANIMYYEADNLKSEWAGILAEAPKAFAESYASNMRDPLIDMKDRTAETAAAAEKLAAAVRAAGFDAKTFGDNMARAREEILTGGGFNPFGGPPETGETGMGVNPGGRKFPWQGDGPSGSPIVVPSTPTDSKDRAKSGPAAPPAPKTAKDYETEMRAAAAAARFSERASSLQERGFYQAAGQAMQRADRAAQDVRDRADISKFLGDQYGSGTMGEAYEKYRRQTGMDRDSREEFERRTREKALTDSERRAKDEERRSGEQPASRGGGAGNNKGLATEGTLKQILNKIQERPILVA